MYLLAHRWLTNHAGFSPPSSWTALPTNVASLVLLCGWWHKVRENSPIPAPLSLPSHFSPFPISPYNKSLSQVTEIRSALCHVTQSATRRQILGQGWRAFAFFPCELHLRASGGKLPPQLWQTIRQTDRARCPSWESQRRPKLQHINADYWESLRFILFPVHLVRITSNF